MGHAAHLRVVQPGGGGRGRTAALQTETSSAAAKLKNCARTSGDSSRHHGGSPELQIPRARARHRRAICVRRNCSSCLSTNIVHKLIKNTTANEVFSFFFEMGWICVVLLKTGCARSDSKRARDKKRQKGVQRRLRRAGLLLLLQAREANNGCACGTIGVRGKNGRDRGRRVRGVRAQKGGEKSCDII